MKQTSSPAKSIISTPLVILTFIALSGSSLRADTVYTGTGSTATPEPGCALSPGASTAGGYSGSTSYKSSAPGNRTACTAGGRYNAGGAVADSVPWVQLAPTLGACGGTYILYGTRGTAFSSDSPDAIFNITPVANCTVSAGTTGFFNHSGFSANNWTMICTVTLAPGQTIPTIKFTFHSASVPLDTSHRIAVNGFKFDQVVDGTGTADCGGITTPVYSTDTAVTVTGCSAGATAIIIEDTSAGNALLGTSAFPCDGNTPASVSVSVSGLVAGHTIKAIQTIGGVTSRRSTAPSALVAAPSGAPDVGGITTPIYSDDTTVTATGVDPNATSVKVYHGIGLLGSTATPGGGTTPSSVAVTVSALTQGWLIYATQVVGGNESSSGTAPTATVSGPRCTTVVDVGGITTPVYDTATSITVTGCDPAATSVAIYHNTTQLGVNNSPAGAATVAVNVSALTAGWVISAVQTTNGVTSCTGNKTATVQPICASVANVGGFSGALDGGASTITVTGCSVSASTIKVYQSAILVGSAAGGTATVNVPCTGLTKGSTLKATQIISGQESCLSSAPSSTPVGSGSPKKLRFAIGLRNTPGAAAPLGTDGGGVFANNIYLLGANGGNFSQFGPPTGIPAKNIIAASGQWQTLDFSPGDPSWNGSLNVAGTPQGNAGAGGSSWAVLEGLYVVPDDATDTGEYKIYIDNVGNGTQGVLQTFENNAAGTLSVLFHQPSFSGTTAGSLLLTAPNTELVTTDHADTGAQSALANFQFNGMNAGNWLRLTTASGGGITMPNPSVDITQPITVRVLLLAPRLNYSRTDATHLSFTWTGTDVLQSATNVNGPYTTIGGATSGYAYTINPATPQTFFRLSSP